MTTDKLTALVRAVAGGKGEAQGLAQEAISLKVGAEEILREALIPAMKKVGEGMQEEEYAFPEIQASVKSLQSVLDVLRPSFGNAKPLGAIPKWEGKGELYEVGGHLMRFMEKAVPLKGYDLILFFDECVKGLLEQIDIPCHKQAISTQKT